MPLLLLSSLVCGPAARIDLLMAPPLPSLLTPSLPCFHAILAAYQVLTSPSASCVTTDVMQPPCLKLPRVCKATQ